MKAWTLAIILASVTVTAVAQIALKHGMSSPVVRSGLAAGGWWEAALAVFSNAWVLVGLSLYGLGAIMWLAVLSRAPVSVAYPFVGLGFVITTLLAWRLLGEDLTAGQIAGTALVAVGVLLIGRGA